MYEQRPERASEPRTNANDQQDENSMDQLIPRDQSFLDVDTSPPPRKSRTKADPMMDSVDRRDSRHSVVTGPRSKDPNNRRLDRAALE